VDVRCQHCGKTHQVPRDIFGGAERVTLTCSGCGNTFPVVNPKLTTLRIDTTRKKIPSVTADTSLEGRKLRLPEDQELSLKVLEGEEKGTVYPLSKPRVTIGRTNADITLSDRMASRLHCTLEVGDDGVFVRDLGSTNGTLVNNKPVSTAKLSHGSKFRVGRHLFQLVVAAKGK
jgi:transcription elongation factor Elf1